MSLVCFTAWSPALASRHNSLGMLLPTSCGRSFLQALVQATYTLAAPLPISPPGLEKMVEEVQK